MADLIARLLGGRPMQCEGFAFADIVSGRHVYYWRDRLGRSWLAENAWALFRVRPAPVAKEKE